jgi:NADH-quinone oxidoreductase subunit C
VGASGYAGGDTRFQVMCRLHNVDSGVGITLKVDLADDAPAVATISDVFAGADWHERETWEMYGFVFDGHPGLRHLYLPGAFEGYPLRKDFPLLAREIKPWPGLVDKEPMPGEEAGDDEEGSGE